MKILWVNPSFLDYRVPVYDELNRLVDGQLTILYSKKRVPERVNQKVIAALGQGAKGLDGERTFSIRKTNSNEMANSGLRIPFQPGLLRAVRKSKADVIIAEGFFQWTPAAFLKKMLQRTPLVLSYERTFHTERKCPWWRTQYRKLCLRYIDSAVCNGQLCKEYTESLGLHADRITTGGMAADSLGLRKATSQVSDSEKLSLKKKLGLSGPIFLYVGYLIERKGIVELLKGWEVYKRNMSGKGSLLLVGDGSQQECLKQLVIDRELPDVCFTGRVDYDSIAQYYAASDVFVMPTLEDNWSLVVPEAMACGLPIACSKYNGCWPELVKDGVNGKVFDPHKPEDIANTLEYFANNLDRCPEMGQRSQEIEGEYTPAKVARSILKACEIAVSSRKNR